MAYNKTYWINNQEPAINADNLNNIENGIYGLYKILFKTTNEFSEDENYSEGDYTIYNKTLYKCTTIHPAGVWDDTHFTESSVFID